MHLGEPHVLKRADRRFAALDRAAFAAKNRYHAANDELRQSFIHAGVYLTDHPRHQRMQDQEAYQALPAKVAQWVLRLRDKHWQRCLAAWAAWQADPAQCLGRPKLPGDTDQQPGRTLRVSTPQALGVPALRQGVIAPSRLGSTVQTKQANVQQGRSVARPRFDVVEVIYEQAPVQAPVDPAWQAGVDRGRDTLATLASDQPGLIARRVTGRPVKSSNQFDHKRRAALQSRLGRTGTRAHVPAPNGSRRAARDRLPTSCTPRPGASLTCSSPRTSGRW